MISLRKVIKGNQIIEDLIQPFKEYRCLETHSESQILTENSDAIDEERRDTSDQRVFSAKQEREQILEEAKKRVSQMEEEARVRIQEMEDKAYDVGFKQGKKAGYEEGVQEAKIEVQERYDDELKKFQRALYNQVLEIQVEKENRLALYEEELKDVAITIAEKVIHTSLKASREIVGKMILLEAENLNKPVWAKVYIGKGDDVMSIHTDPAFLNKIAKIADEVKIVVMDKEEQGTCIIESPEGIMDISVKTQIENVRDILHNART